MSCADFSTRQHGASDRCFTGNIQQLFPLLYRQRILARDNTLNKRIAMLIFAQLQLNAQIVQALRLGRRQLRAHQKAWQSHPH